MHMPSCPKPETRELLKTSILGGSMLAGLSASYGYLLRAAGAEVFMQSRVDSNVQDCQACVF